MHPPHLPVPAGGCAPGSLCGTVQLNLPSTGVSGWGARVSPSTGGSHLAIICHCVSDPIVSNIPLTPALHPAPPSPYAVTDGPRPVAFVSPRGPVKMAGTGRTASGTFTVTSVGSLLSPSAMCRCC